MSKTTAQAAWMNFFPLCLGGTEGDLDSAASACSSLVKSFHPPFGEAGKHPRRLSP
jgi:hypothetical protein